MAIIWKKQTDPAAAEEAVTEAVEAFKEKEALDEKGLKARPTLYKDFGLGK